MESFGVYFTGMPDDANTPPPPDSGPRSVSSDLFDLGLRRKPGSAPSRAWQPPTVEALQRALPQYEITQLVARGGMGAVYKGTQKTLKRVVAIKVLPPEADDGDRHFAERFEREAQAMARLNHPNIVAVYDAGETTDGLLYFVMEFVEGTDVAQLIASQGRLEAKRAVEITLAVCDALGFAHEEGIIHRDIKPSNVMIDGKGCVKVADFGLAKVVDADGSLLTRSDMMVGSAHFMAPEAQVRGVEVDGRADLYSLGVMLYQMLTGKIPRGRFELPSGIVPRIDPALDTIVDKAMQTDREKRYASADEMKRAIERIAWKFPAGSMADGERPKPRWRVLAMVGVIAVVCGALWYHSSGGPKTSKAAAGVSPPARQDSIADTRSHRWRDALAQSPLKEVIAKAGHTAQGYRLPKNSHWHVTASCRAGVLRVRAAASGEKFLSLYIAYDDGKQERIRFRELTKHWVLSRSAGGVTDTPIATKAAQSPSDGQPHDLVFIRLGGRVKVTLDGTLIHDEADPGTMPGRFLLDVYEDSEVFVEKVEYMILDGIPEAEASKLIGADSDGKSSPDVKSSSSATAVDAAHRQWRPVPPKPNATMDRGAVHLMHFDAWGAPDLSLVNAAVRATIAWQPCPPGKNDLIQVKVRWTETGHYYAALNGPDVELGHYRGVPPNVALKRWPVEPPPGPGEAISLQLACIGHRLAVWVRGSLVGVMDDDTLSTPGSISVQAVDGHIQRLEYLDLDRLPIAEAFRRLGLDPTGSSASAKPAANSGLLPTKEYSPAKKP